MSPTRRSADRNTRPACSATLCKRTLRAEFEFEFAGEILALELLVLADVGGDHLPDLTRAEQPPQPDSVDAGIVRHAGKVGDPKPFNRPDQGFAKPAKAEAADEKRLQVLQNVEQRIDGIDRKSTRLNTSH